MSKPEVVTIHVFPESGHHYTFVPIERAVLDQDPALKRRCSNERSEWLEVNYPWVRARFAMKDGVPGIWVAVESNLGAISRGSIYEPLHEVNDTVASQINPANPSPYAAESATRLPDEKEIVIRIPSSTNPQTTLELARLQVVWKRPSGLPIDVDLIVDFGNTRTVVLALEKVTSQFGKLSSVCRSIRFLGNGVDYEPFTGRKADDSCAIVDSWFILHEPPFSSLEPPSEKFRPQVELRSTEQVTSTLFSKKVEKKHEAVSRVPQMFVELSPVVMGEAAREILGNLDVGVGGNYTLSSPKRYVWDHDPVGRDALGYWTMKLNRWNPAEKNRSELPRLAGSMLRYLPLDGRNWSIDDAPNEAAEAIRRPRARPEKPSYPRADAMTWAALGIIELAHRQITSEQWRKNNEEFLPRRLRNIMVTFPSGWSEQEVRVYREKWQKAINVFTLAHLHNRRSVLEGGDRPELLMDLDEAVASQLPFIYSEIRRLGNVGENWIELFGRGKGTDARVRVMTVDIGGGTTDISVVEYGDEQGGDGVDLKARLLFRDSSSTAGDTLAKQIIEQVLLPSLGAAVLGNDEQTSAFENMFSAPHQRAGDKAQWSRIVKLVFLPIVRQWLKDLSAGQYGNPESGDSWSPDRIMGANGPLVDEAAVRELNERFQTAGLLELMGYSTPIPYSEEHLKQCVEDVFRPLISSLSKYVAAYEVDLVTLSGKPSELPKVKQLLEENLPILPQRIIPAKDYPAGDWYPMTSDLKINDAKSVTAVGAALYQAMKNGQIDQWRITREESEAGFRNFWGTMPTTNNPFRFGKVLLEPPQEEATHRLAVNTRIGRKALPSAAKPEQVYRLRWRNPEQWAKVGLNAFLEVTLAREERERADQMEGLHLVDVQGEVGGQPVKKDDLELQLCTLEGDEFWVDNARFDVYWPSTFSASAY